MTRTPANPFTTRTATALPPVGTTVTVKTRKVPVIIQRANIESIEYLGTLDEQFNQRIAKLDAKDVNGRGAGNVAAAAAAVGAGFGALLGVPAGAGIDALFAQGRGRSITMKVPLKIR